jgi:hypothetical protein
VAVVAEESEELVLELRELLLARIALVPFHVVVKEVDRFGFEEFSDFGVLVDYVAEVHLVDLRVDGFVSESGPEEHPGENGEGLEAEGEIPELVEEDGEGGQYEDLEGILEAPAAVVDSF